MKKRLALLAVVAVGALTVAALKNQKKKSAEPVKNTEPILEPQLSLPELPKESLLSKVLLESYRVQCQVMMDGYPEDMTLDIHHHIECEDLNQKETLLNALVEFGYTKQDTDQELNIFILKSIPTSSQEAFDSVLEVAELAHQKGAKYQGWIFENCR